MTIKNWKKESVEKSWFLLPEGLAIKRAELVAGAGTFTEVLSSSPHS